MPVAARDYTPETMPLPSRWDVPSPTEVKEPRVVVGGEFTEGLFEDTTTPRKFLLEAANDLPSDEDKLDGELLSYRDLALGWDGYDGVPASGRAVADALAALRKRPSDIPLPDPQLAPDGEVGVYWRHGAVYAELGFYGDGKFSYYARITTEFGEKQEDGHDECSLDAEWPEPLLLILNKLHR